MHDAYVLGVTVKLDTIRFKRISKLVDYSVLTLMCLHGIINKSPQYRRKQRCEGLRRELSE